MSSSTNLARSVNVGQLGRQMYLNSPHLYKQQQNKQTNKQTYYHPIDRITHTSHGVLAGTRNSSMRPP